MCIICTNEYTVDTTYIECCSEVTVIPDTLVNLTFLYCTSTKITVIPDTLVNLTNLYCNDTKITKIPDNLVNLSKLYCSDTNITVIPDTLVNLTELYCSNTEIQYIPFTIKYCTKNIIKYNLYYLRKFQKNFRKKQFTKIINDIPMHTNISRYLVMPEL